MITEFNIEATPEQVEQLDTNSFDYGLDDYIWFENSNTKICTENEKAVVHLQEILNELEIEFTTTKRD